MFFNISEFWPFIKFRLWRTSQPYTKIRSFPFLADYDELCSRIPKLGALSKIPSFVNFWAKHKKNDLSKRSINRDCELGDTNTSIAV